MPTVQQVAIGIHRIGDGIGDMRQWKLTVVHHQYR
ncbi:Uncharacterised protein [Mycobacteroides abscessus subsp. abscessus]|nr:Uncharacterised protein [Mycobacteroides abscessus subsp. abscessus]